MFGLVSLRDSGGSESKVMQTQQKMYPARPSPRNLATSCRAPVNSESERLDL